VSSRPIAPGDEILCPHCKAWHVLALQAADGVKVVSALFFRCAGTKFGERRHFAGMAGDTIRYETRRQAPRPN